MKTKPRKKTEFVEIVRTHDFYKNQEKCKDALILIRDEDFYVSLNEDAKKAAKVLGLVLVEKDGVKCAAFPHHALDTYLPKLIRNGIRCAIADGIVTTYKVTVTETYVKTVVVSATSKISACQKVRQMYKDEEIVLNDSDFLNSEIEVMNEKEQGL